MCQITLAKPILMYLEEDDHTFVLAQRFPTFGEVSLRNKCVLTCDKQKDGLGGILAFGAGRLLIDETSKIDMSGKGRSKSCCGCLNYQKCNKFFFTIVHIIKLIIRSFQLDPNQKHYTVNFQVFLGVTEAINEEVEGTVAKHSFLLSCSSQQWVKGETSIMRPGQRTGMGLEEEGPQMDQGEQQVSETHCR